MASGTESRPDSTFPIIDLKGPGPREIGWQIRQACEGSGFFYLVNHGVQVSEIDGILAANARFHALPLARKLSVQMNGSFRGYQPVGGSTLRLSTVETARRPNQSESFFARHEHVSSRNGRCVIDGPNQWPEGLPGFRARMQAYHEALCALGQRLVALLAHALEEPPAAFARRYFERPSTALRLLHYPPHPDASPRDSYGIAPHTDYGFLTLLAQDNRGGLQIRAPSGAWQPVEAVAGALVVNVGDALARMTGGRFASTPHRVINPSQIESRYSAAFFFDPGLDVEIDTLPAFRSAHDAPQPLRYGDYYLERLATNFEYGPVSKELS